MKEFRHTDVDSVHTLAIYWGPGHGITLSTDGPGGGDVAAFGPEDMKRLRDFLDECIADSEC